MLLMTDCKMRGFSCFFASKALFCLILVFLMFLGANGIFPDSLGLEFEDGSGDVFEPFHLGGDGVRNSSLLKSSWPDDEKLQEYFQVSHPRAFRGSIFYPSQGPIPKNSHDDIVPRRLHNESPKSSDKSNKSVTEDEEAEISQGDGTETDNDMLNDAFMGVTNVSLADVGSSNEAIHFEDQATDPLTPTREISPSNDIKLPSRRSFQMEQSSYSSQFDSASYLPHYNDILFEFEGEEQSSSTASCMPAQTEDENVLRMRKQELENDDVSQSSWDCQNPPSPSIETVEIHNYVGLDSIEVGPRVSDIMTSICVDEPTVECTQKASNSDGTENSTGEDSEVSNKSVDNLCSSLMHIECSSNVGDCDSNIEGIRNESSSCCNYEFQPLNDAICGTSSFSSASPPVGKCSIIPQKMDDVDDSSNDALVFRLGFEDKFLNRETSFDYVATYDFAFNFDSSYLRVDLYSDVMLEAEEPQIAYLNYPSREAFPVPDEGFLLLDPTKRLSADSIKHPVENLLGRRLKVSKWRVNKDYVDNIVWNKLLCGDYLKVPEEVELFRTAKLLENAELLFLFIVDDYTRDFSDYPPQLRRSPFDVMKSAYHMMKSVGYPIELVQITRAKNYINYSIMTKDRYWPSIPAYNHSRMLTFLDVQGIDVYPTLMVLDSNLNLIVRNAYQAVAFANFYMPWNDFKKYLFLPHLPLHFPNGYALSSFSETPEHSECPDGERSSSRNIEDTLQSTSSQSSNGQASSQGIQRSTISYNEDASCNTSSGSSQPPPPPPTSCNTPSGSPQPTPPPDVLCNTSSGTPPPTLCNTSSGTPPPCTLCNTPSLSPQPPAPPSSSDSFAFKSLLLHHSAARYLLLTFCKYGTGECFRLIDKVSGCAWNCHKINKFKVMKVFIPLGNNWDDSTYDLDALKEDEWYVLANDGGSPQTILRERFGINDSSAVIAYDKITGQFNRFADIDIALEQQMFNMRLPAHWLAASNITSAEHTLDTPFALFHLSTAFLEEKFTVENGANIIYIFKDTIDEARASVVNAAYLRAIYSWRLTNHEFPIMCTNRRPLYFKLISKRWQMSSFVKARLNMPQQLLPADHLSPHGFPETKISYATELAVFYDAFANVSVCLSPSCEMDENSISMMMDRYCFSDIEAGEDDDDDDDDDDDGSLGGSVDEGIVLDMDNTSACDDTE